MQSRPGTKRATASEDGRTARPGSDRWAWIAAVALLTMAGALLRTPHLDHPMRYDESFTVLRYAFQPAPSDWLDYSTPNNHVLHTLMVRGVVEFGGVTPPAVRIPAFLAGVALIPAAAWAAQRLSGKPPTAVAAAALVGASSLLVEYSANARGYSLVCLLTVLLIPAAVGALRRPERYRPWVAMSVLSALGAFTIPIMVYPVAIVAFAMGVQALLTGGERRGMVFRRLGVTLAAAAGLTVVLYLPVFAVSGVESVLANRFVTPRPRAEVLAELPGVAARTLGDWTRDTSWAWQVVVGAGLVAATVVGVRRRKVLWLIPPVAVVLLFLAAVLHGVVPFPRVWLFMLPLSLVTAGSGLCELAALFRRNRPRTAALMILCLAVLLCAADAGARSLRRRYMVSEDHRTLVDAGQIIRDLHSAGLADGRTAVLSQLPSQPSLAYYSLLYAPEGFRLAADPRCTRAVAVVGHTQTLESVLKANAPAGERFGPFRHWRQYARADVYVATAGRR
ncbi:MAG: hypothetical protein ACP5HU_10635 [Phycisphaerae bacterium]